MSDKINIPRVVIAALKGGAGKTLLTLGMVAALRKRGLNTSVFKKGPDYIDSGWLGMAAGDDCYNLDAYLFDQNVVRSSFVRRSAGKDAAVIEGNRGLFDGVDSAGSFSTAEMAKLLEAPVILIVDATKMTRTAAAMVLGCKLLDPKLDLAGVILNRVAGARHDTVLRQAIEEGASVPVIGSVNKLPMENFPQRHLGLLPLYEHPQAMEFVDEAARIVENSIDLDRVISIAQSAGEFAVADADGVSGQSTSESPVRIGVLKDSAFQFYYPENLEALRENGAELVFISALAEKEIPDLDGLYIGGGFPETHAEILAKNMVFKKSLKEAVDSGLPVYAECGGLMYLSRTLQIDGSVYPMVGVFPVDSVLERKPQGHGYIQVEVVEHNSFYPKGTVLTGHEFHYSYVTGLDRPGASYAFRILRGHGMDGARDGICYKNALGTYLHIHALGHPLWAKGIVERARGHLTWSL
ncbi:MAG: hydrogenobyrinic acid a,c-diamide synthase (glutamine-hydrolyzing) [Desulfomonile tiedjei]|uniref:Cobyrinate a,c-diamide synthase n=1 Tax=Desulfomonile tiedjei TaxID=2358 RepID=A0A9D6V256_9BACT|nr:hydrogenobyrinic acid a,c-diamide synthase (glutamine-hydrolyzing) [Desulfomonile tiedjei]